MDKHADGCLRQEAKIRARLGVGGYVMDGRDSVIGRPRKGWIVADQTRAEETGEGVGGDVPQPKTHVGGAIRRHGSNVS